MNTLTNPSVSTLLSQLFDRARATDAPLREDLRRRSPEERAAFMAGYKAAAGFAIDQLNKAPPTIAPGARVPPPRPTR